MKAARRGFGLPLAAVGSIVAGVVYFASRLGAFERGAGTTALAILAGLVLWLVAVRFDPAWLLCAGIVSTMFASHWQLLGLSTVIGPDRILLAAASLALLLRLGPSRSRPEIPLGGVHLLLGAALAYALISGFAAGTLGRHDDQFELLDQYGALPFFMFLLAPVAFRTARQRQIFLGSLVAVGFYLGVTALLERLHFTALVVPHYISNANVGIHYGRARGPFVDAGADGLAMFGCVLAGVVAFRTWSRSRWRTLAAVEVGLGLLGVLLTETRGDWLAAASGAVVALLTTPTLRRFLLPTLLAAALLVVGAFGALPGLGSQAQSRLNDQSSVYERDNTNAAGVRMLAARPLLGFGWLRGDDQVVGYLRVSPDIPLTAAKAGFHNLFLQYAVALGAVGFALWLLATGAALGGAIRGPASHSLAEWPAGLKAIVVAWIVMGFTAPSEYIFSTLTMWTWAGILYGPRLWTGASAAVAAPPVAWQAS